MSYIKHITLLSILFMPHLDTATVKELLYILYITYTIIEYLCYVQNGDYILILNIILKCNIQMILLVTNF